MKSSVALIVGGIQIEVWSDSPILVDLLADYFRPFLTERGNPDVMVEALEGPSFVPSFDLIEKTPDPGKTRVKEEYADLIDGRLVRKRLTGMVFFMGDTVNLAVGSCVANVNQIVNFVNSRYIELLLRRGGLLCHASAVARGRHCVVVAGVPGAGKSTLALRLMDSGLDFVSNDRLVLTRDRRITRVHGIPKLPRVNPGTLVGQARLRRVLSEDELAQAEALPTAELWQMEKKFDVPLEGIYGPGRFRLEADLAGAIILGWRFGGGECKIEWFDPETQPTLIHPLMKSPGLFYRPESGFQPDDDSPDPGQYVSALSGSPTLYASGGVDFEAVAEACSKLIGLP